MSNAKENWKNAIDHMTFKDALKAFAGTFKYTDRKQWQTETLAWMLEELVIKFQDEYEE